MLKEYLYVRKSVIGYFIILVLLLFFWFIVYAMNGTSTSFPYLFFIPILLASFHLGLIPAIIVAIISGVLMGPFMYLDVANEVQQTTVNWVIRMIFYIIIA